ncbi:hypothetical protein MRX96_008937 [Rhipicephalus microplus]
MGWNEVPKHDVEPSLSSCRFVAG